VPDVTTPIGNPRLTRRDTLVSLGGLVALAAGWRAEEGDTAVGPAGVASGAVTCVLAPELTEGPYYIANERLRSDITEGKPGTPLTLKLAVVDASSCRALSGALVDLWHCDAGGIYSGYSSLSSGAAAPTFGPGGHVRPTDKLTFCRGVQRTNAHGLATFETIYPGWYRGRTVHIHVKVHLGGRVAHTGQLFFPDSLTDAVYRHAPYSGRPGRDTQNASDSIFRNGGSRSLLTLKRAGTGYAASITMGVARG
jgi:protocatechuate 3,4-dioxygenase beta subunit